MGSPPQTKYWQTREFKKLEDKWEEKLKKSGFEDIERPLKRKDGLRSGPPGSKSPDGRMLINFVASKSAVDQDQEHEQCEQSKEYYRVAGQFLWEHKFTSETERVAWQLHAEGLSILDIMAELAKKRRTVINGRKVCKRHVHEAVQRLAKMMLKGIS